MSIHFWWQLSSWKKKEKKIETLCHWVDKRKVNETFYIFQFSLGMLWNIILKSKCGTSHLEINGSIEVEQQEEIASESLRLGLRHFIVRVNESQPCFQALKAACALDYGALLENKARAFKTLEPHLLNHCELTHLSLWEAIAIRWNGITTSCVLITIIMDGYYEIKRENLKHVSWF